MTTAAELASYASSFPSFRNRIINGNFDIWQRGTSQTSSGYGSADRWRMINNGSTKTASQQAFTVGQTDVPGNPKYYLRHVVTSSSSNANSVFFDQHIENVRTLSGKTVTLSFYAKADSNKSIATEFTQYFGSGGSPSSFNTGIGVNTHNLTTSWQKFTATVAIPSISGKTIGTDGNDTIDILFWLDAGSDFNSRTNSLGQQSGTFDIAQVQVEEGTVATQFEHRPIGTELSLCKRYFQIYDGTYYVPLGTMVFYNATEGLCNFTFSQEMRSAPSLYATPRIALVYNGNVINYSSTSVSFNQASKTSASVKLTGASGFSSGYSVNCFGYGTESGHTPVQIQAEL